MATEGCWKGRTGMMPCTLPSILQVMPEGRVRLDPTIVRDLAVYLMVRAKAWIRESNRTLSGLKGLDRAREAGKIKYAKHACAAVQSLINGLMDTVALADVHDARDQWGIALKMLDDAAQQPMPTVPPDDDARKGE